MRDLLSRLWPALGNLHRSAEVRVLPDVPYADDGHRKHALDLYLPRALPLEGRGFPLVLFVHGGLAPAHDRRFFQRFSGLYGNVGVALAARGVGAAIAGYRQLPDAARLDDSLSDLALAARFLVEHGEEHGGRPGSLVLVGHSMGATLAALLALDPRLRPALGPAAAAVRAVVLLAGAHDLERLGPLLPKKTAGALQRLTRGEALARYSPERAVRPDMPPCLLLVGAREVPSLLQEHRAMEAALAGVGARFDAAVVDDATHMGLVLAMGSARDRVTDRVVDFLGRYA